MPKNEQSRGPMLWILIGGGVFVLLLCCLGIGGGGIGAYFLWFSGPSIAGNWESDGRKWEFHRGGTGKLTVQVPIFGKEKSKEIIGHFDYKLIQGDPLTLEMKFTRGEGDVPDGMKKEIGVTKRFNAVLKGDTMTLSEVGRGNPDDAVTLKRVP